MHPEIARQMITHHNRDLAAMARPRRASRRLALPRLAVPVWRVTWSRVAAPAGSDRSWLIVISARRARLGV